MGSKSKAAKQKALKAVPPRPAPSPPTSPPSAPPPTLTPDPATPAPPASPHFLDLLTKYVAWFALFISAVSAFGTGANAYLNYRNSQPKLPILVYMTGTAVPPEGGLPGIECIVENRSDVAARDVYVDCATNSKTSVVEATGSEIQTFERPRRVLVKISLIPPHSASSVIITPSPADALPNRGDFDIVGILRVFTAHTNAVQQREPTPWDFH